MLSAIFYFFVEVLNYRRGLFRVYYLLLVLCICNSKIVCTSETEYRWPSFPPYRVNISPRVIYILLYDTKHKVEMDGFYKITNDATEQVMQSGYKLN